MQTVRNKAHFTPNSLVVLGRGRYVTPVECGSGCFFDLKDEMRGLLLERVGEDTGRKRECWMILLNGERLLAWEDQFRLAQQGET